MNTLKNNHIILVVILVIIVAAVGFYAGMKYQQNQRGVGFAGRAGAGAGMYRQFAGGAGSPTSNTQAVRGQILSVSNDTMTVKLADGSSKIVILPSSVNISKQTTGSTSDLKTGSVVIVLGTSNSDGSVTAENVALNPTFGGPRGGMMMNGNQPSPSQ